jgi:hypothetical protein
VIGACRSGQVATSTASIPSSATRSCQRSKVRGMPSSAATRRVDSDERFATRRELHAIDRPEPRQVLRAARSRPARRSPAAGRSRGRGRGRRRDPDLGEGARAPTRAAAPGRGSSSRQGRRDPGAARRRL